MAEAKSLLSLIARGYAAGREDAATEALCFILSRSDSARDGALPSFLVIMVIPCLSLALAHSVWCTARIRTWPASTDD